MKHVNFVRITGNVGSAPEQRKLPSGASVVTFSVATTKCWRKRDSDAWSERTDWHRVEAFGRLADEALFLTQGSLVTVEGESLTDRVADKSGGADRFFTKVRATSLNELVKRQIISQPAQPENSPEMSDHQEFIDAMEA